MGVHLTQADLEHLTAAQETILSVASHASVATWSARTVAAAGRFLRSDRVMLLVPHRDGVEMRCSPEMTPFLEPARRAFAGVDVGANRYRVPQVEASQRLRRRLGIELWTNRMLVELHGAAMEEAGWYYHEFIERAGVASGGGMTVRLPVGEALLLATPGRTEPNPFGEDWLDVAGLLLPPFKAAVRHLQREQGRWAQLLGGVDELSAPIWIWTRDGRELHRNPALERLLAEEDTEDRVRAEVADLVRSCALRRRFTKSGPGPLSPVGERELASPTGSTIRMRAVFFGDDVLGETELVLVELERPGPLLPSASEVRARWRLTPRQAEVAILLAGGASNREVARALAISPHTVRSHAEIVFQKLGIHSRKALGLLLMSARTP